MFIPQITAQQYLEGMREAKEDLVVDSEGVPQPVYIPAESVSADRYFELGGSLRDVNARIRALIRGGFFQNPNNAQIKGEIRSRLNECIQYMKGHPIPYTTDTVVIYLWNQVWSDANGQEQQAEALALWTELSKDEISPINPLTLVNSDKTLSQVVIDIYQSIIWAQEMPSPSFIREVRSRLYHLVKVRWQYQTQTTHGFVISSVKAAFWRWRGRPLTSLERALTVFKEIDAKLGRTVNPNAPDLAGKLDFKDAAWLTDGLLLEFVQKMPGSRKVDVRGCFQLTEEGLSKAEATAGFHPKPLIIIADGARATLSGVEDMDKGEGKGWVRVDTLHGKKKQVGSSESARRLCDVPVTVFTGRSTAPPSTYPDPDLLLAQHLPPTLADSGSLSRAADDIY